MRRIFLFLAIFSVFLILSMSFIPSAQSSIVKEEIEYKLNNIISNVFIIYFIVIFLIGSYYGFLFGWNTHEDSIFAIRLLFAIFLSIYFGIVLPFVAINAFILEPIIAFIKYILKKPLILAENYDNYFSTIIPLTYTGNTIVLSNQ